MKKIILLLIIVIICGCSNTKEEQKENKIEKKVDNIEAVEETKEQPKGFFSTLFGKLVK